MGVEFIPQILYGVAEANYDRVIGRNFLEKHQIEASPEYIANGYAGNFVYGVEVSFKDLEDGRVPAKVKGTVGKFVAALKDNGVYLGEPKVHLAISSGNYELCHDEYLGEDEEDDDENGEEEQSEDDQDGAE